MVFEQIAENLQLFFLIFARVFGLIRIAPLLSSTAIPAMVRNGLAFFVAAAIFPWVSADGYPIPENGTYYGLLLAGELMVGIVIGFFLLLVFSAFQLAGQFFSLQMGFGASTVFDPLSQVEIPVVGQFLNLISMFIFIVIQGFSRIFLTGVYRSFQAMRAVDLVIHRNAFFALFSGSLGRLFEEALIISFPILGTIFLVMISVGLLAKAAPQMNLLVLGFPISIGVAFLMILVTLPFIVEAFGRIIDAGFDDLLVLLDRIWRSRA